MELEFLNKINEKIATVHQQFLDQQYKNHQIFLEIRENCFNTFLSTYERKFVTNKPSLSHDLTCKESQPIELNLDTESKNNQLKSSDTKSAHSDITNFSHDMNLRSSSDPLSKNSNSPSSAKKTSISKDPPPSLVTENQLETVNDKNIISNENWYDLYADNNLDNNNINNFWSHKFGFSKWILEDLVDGLSQKFINNINIECQKSIDEIKNQACIIITNQQVGIEKILLQYLFSPIFSKPISIVLRKNHLKPWIKLILDQTFEKDNIFECKPDIFYFDPQSNQNVAQLDQWLESKIEKKDPILLPILNSVPTYKGTRLTKLGKYFLSFIDKTNLHIVPILSEGGLPSRPVDKYLEFPYAMSKIDFNVLKPIKSSLLADLSLSKREKFIKDTLSPSLDIKLISADEKFARLVHQWMLDSGVNVNYAVLFCILKQAKANGYQLSPQSIKILDVAEKNTSILESFPHISDKNIGFKSIAKELLGSKYC